MSDDRLDRFLEDLRTEADSHHFMDLAEPAIAAGTRRSPWARLRRRTATVMATALVSVIGLSGAAFASDGAVPGDLLYPFDRAFEAVGIGAGGDEERLEEALALVDRGDVDRGLEHAASLVDDPEAQAAIEAAAARVAEAPADGDDDTEATERPEGVDDLLTYLTDADGEVDGPTVAELARRIAGPDAATPPEDLPVDVTPGEPPVVVPAPSEGAPDDLPPSTLPTGDDMPVPEDLPDVVPGDLPEDASDGGTDDVPDEAPEGVPGGPPEDLPGGAPGGRP